MGASVLAIACKALGKTAASEQTELGHLQVGLGNSTARLPKVGPCCVDPRDIWGFYVDWVPA